MVGEITTKRIHKGRGSHPQTGKHRDLEVNLRHLTVRVLCGPTRPTLILLRKFPQLPIDLPQGSTHETTLPHSTISCAWAPWASITQWSFKDYRENECGTWRTAYTSLQCQLFANVRDPSCFHALSLVSEVRDQPQGTPQVQFLNTVRKRTPKQKH